MMVFTVVSGTATGQVPYKVNDKVDDFSLKNIDGRMVSLANYTDARGFIIIFTCNHCPYAMAYEERIMALDLKYRDEGWPVIAINPNDPDIVPDDGFEEMKARAKERGFTFPYLFDEHQKVYPRFGATRTPHVFIVQKKANKMILRYIGAIDDNYTDVTAVKEHYVEEVINALQAGTESPYTVTKAIGCTIKHKKE